MSISENPVKNNSSIIPPSESVKNKFWLCAEVALICLLIVVVWILVSLPIIVFNLPKSKISSNTSGDTNDSYNVTVGSAPILYNTTSGICLTELTDAMRYSHCIPDPEAYLLVMSNEEAIATQLINGLTSLGANAECLRKAVPFLCLHLFGLCGESGIPIQPTSSQCEEIRDTTCPKQWMFIEELDIGLPDCAKFPAESYPCPALNESLPTNGKVPTNILGLEEEYSNYTTEAVPECTGEFYQENGKSYCTRSCSSWVQFGHGFGIIFEILVILSSIASFLASVTVIIISCIAHKRMLIFPSIFLVYMVIDYMIAVVLTLIGNMDRDKFYCTSRSLIKSLTEVTPFCVISGILSGYIFFQMGLWWIFHIATLFWKMMFPFHARAFETSGKIKNIHKTCIMVGLFLPLISTVIVMADTAVDLQNQHGHTTPQIRRSLFLSKGFGFGYNRFPPILCTSTNSDAHFYSVIVVLDLILGCGCTMLIIIIRSVHKLYIHRKQVQKHAKMKIKEESGPQFTFGTAEKKLFIVLFYSVVMTAIVITVNTWNARTSSNDVNNTLKFLFCELGNYNSSNPCILSKVDSIGLTSMRTLSAILLSFIPFSCLLFVVNIQELKTFWKDHSFALLSKTS